MERKERKSFAIFYNTSMLQPIIYNNHELEDKIFLHICHNSNFTIKQ